MFSFQNDYFVQRQQELLKHQTQTHNLTNAVKSLAYELRRERKQAKSRQR